MPAEEMDIITDVGHSGPAEDIDLDLDDAVAHTDDDMELGDYNEQQGATDAVDEMMAEGDDTSDGMVDADEIDYNISAVANSDYDIDIGGTDGNPYEMDNVGQNVDISLGDEIEYTDAVDTEPTDLAHAQATNDVWLQNQDLAGAVTAEGDVTQMEDTPIEDGEQAPVSQDAQATVVIADSAEEVVAPSATHAEVHRNEATKDEQQRNEPAEGGHELENLEGGFEDEESHLEPVVAGSGEPSKEQFTDQNGNTSATLPTESDNQTENLDSLASATMDGAELAEDGNVDGAAAVVQVAEVAEAAKVSETTEALEASWVEEAEETAEAGEDYEAAESSEVAKLDEVNEVPANGDTEARADPTHEDPFENEGHYSYDVEEPRSHENPSDGHINPAVGTVEDAEADNHSQSSRLPRTEITASEHEHPSAIAARYGITIHYSGTDYQLFAKSVDDDPDRYFLSDRSVLDLPLLELLASIRDVIVEEVSPLDELVMHIDGLGLEFGETTTQDYLVRYTFGDMLALYDNLVKNEGTDDTPELYVYLLVRPNCSQRLAALLDQARSGRGLGDVAVYRDSTPAQDDEDPQGEGRVLAISPDIAVDEFFEDFDEEDSSQEQETGENQEQEAGENQEQEAGENQEQETTEQETTEHQEQDVTDYQEQEVTEYQEQIPEDQEQVTEYQEQEVADYQEQEPFEFEEQETVEYHEHDEFDEITQRQEASTDNQDDSGHSEQRAGADAKDTLDSTLATTAPVEMVQGPLEQATNEANSEEDVDLSNYDDNEDGLDVGPAQEDHTDVIGMDSTITEGEGATAPDGQVVDASSHNTSATATLNGDENDEIDYSDGEADEADDAKPRETIASASLQEQADGDFIWESEDEDARKETVVTLPKQSAQVSPTTGKRARSGSDAAEDADAHASVRRRLS